MNRHSIHTPKRPPPLTSNQGSVKYCWRRERVRVMERTSSSVASCQGAVNVRVGSHHLSVECKAI